MPDVRQMSAIRLTLAERAWQVAHKLVNQVAWAIDAQWLWAVNNWAASHYVPRLVKLERLQRERERGDAARLA